MSTTLFREIGPYKIEREIGRGGMALVFLATDTRSGRSVALKVVPDGTDADAREVLAAEQRGAELQQEFSQASQHVPHVYDVGFATGYFYIAMEYIEGEDLSSIIRQGPVAPERAVEVAIKLCRFLEEVDRATTGADGPSRLTLLHNDLKPTNVRLVAGDRVKVLDFGAAKALSLSRKVTRNDFGSIAYLSPECLESGERDRQTDAWAIGVLLYEMVAGRPPFRAEDTRRLENRIRSRKPPELLHGISDSLGAVIAKLLAPYPEDRYENASAIRADLERLRLGVATFAEGQRWPNRAVDEPPTRRTQIPEPDEAPTRKTHTPVTPEPPPVIAASSTTEPSSRSAPRLRRLRTVVLIAILIVVVNEGCVAGRANRLAATVPAAKDFTQLQTVWTEHDAVAERSLFFGLGVRDLRQAIAQQTLILAEGVIGNYRTPAPSVREAQWQAAADALRRALGVVPNDRVMRGAMRYAEGHLHRINGEASKGRRAESEKAKDEFAEALTAFRDAAELRDNWPDPFLGLARTFIYGLEDIERGADAMNKAQKLGYVLGQRETAQLADGYRAQGETLQTAADKLAGMPQERDLLQRSADAYRRALEQYSKMAGMSDVTTSIKLLQRRVEGIEQKLAGGGVPPVDAREGPPWA